MRMVAAAGRVRSARLKLTAHDNQAAQSAGCEAIAMRSARTVRFFLIVARANARNLNRIGYDRLEIVVTACMQ